MVVGMEMKTLRVFVFVYRMILIIDYFDTNCIQYKGKSETKYFNYCNNLYRNK